MNCWMKSLGRLNNARARLADGVYLYRCIYIKLCEVVGGKMIISVNRFTCEEIDELSSKFKLYMMASNVYTSRGLYKAGDDLEADYCARQELRQYLRIIFTEKEEVDAYIKDKLYLSHIIQLNGEFEYEVVDFYEVENGVWKLYKRFISSEEEV